MKYTIKFFSIALVVILMATTVNAQRGGWNADPTERANKMTADMTEKLSLSAKQSEKVGEVNLKYAKKLKELREGMNEESDWSAMREKIMAVRQEQNEEMKTVLTTAQFEQWMSLQEERRKERKSRRGEKGPRKMENNSQENQN